MSKVIISIVITFVLLFYCGNPSHPASGVIPSIGINEPWSVTWYYDSIFTRILEPSSWGISDTGGGMIVRSDPNYRGVIFPDTVYGDLILGSGAMLIECPNDTCNEIGGTKRFLFTVYFDSVKSK